MNTPRALSPISERPRYPSPAPRSACSVALSRPARPAAPIRARRARRWPPNLLRLGRESSAVRNVPTRRRGGQNVATRILAVFHDPINDSAPILQKNIGCAIAIVVAGANNIKPSGFGGEDVAAHVLAVLHDPVDDRAAILQQNVVRAAIVPGAWRSTASSSPVRPAFIWMSNRREITQASQPERPAAGPSVIVGLSCA